MNQFIPSQQQRFVRKWELNNYKTKVKLEERERIEIANFAIKNYLNRTLFTHNGESRQLCILNKTKTEISDLAKKIRQKTFNAIGINDFEEEPLFGIFLGVNNELGFVHEHTDPTHDGFYHFRLNFLISKPENGGMPIINGQEFQVTEGESWVNIASKWKHKSTPVVGKKPRIVLSLGGLVEYHIIDNIIKEMGLK